MTPAASVRPDAHNVRPLASSTSKVTKARRNPTPEGNLCPTWLVILTSAESAVASRVRPLIAIAAVAARAWSSIACSVLTSGGTPFRPSIGSRVRMPRMSGNCFAILMRTRLSPTSVCTETALPDGKVGRLRPKVMFDLREIAELLDRGDLAPPRVSRFIARRHVTILAGLAERAGAERQRPVGRGSGAIGAERPLRVRRLLVDVAEDCAVAEDRAGVPCGSCRRPRSPALPGRAAA